MEEKGVRTSQFVFIKWLEDPPKWNVVPVRHVKCTGELKTGKKVEAKWGTSYHSAVVLDLGTQNAMEKHVLEAEEKVQRESAMEKEDSCNDEDYGKGCRAKKYRKLDKEESSAADSRAVSKKTAKKQHDRLHSMAVLKEIQNADEHHMQRECSGCDAKDKVIEKLRKDIKILQDINITSKDVHGLAQRLEDAVCWFEDQTERLGEKANTVRETSTSTGSSPVPPVATAIPSTLPTTPMRLPTPQQTPSARSPPATTPTSRPTSSQEPKMITIGPCTLISSMAYNAINFDDKKKAVRDLLVAVFGRDTLQTSSMRGQVCHGNKNKHPGLISRPALDQGKLNDTIVYLVNRLKMAQSEVKDVIRKKINDENNIVVKAKKRTAVPDEAIV